MASTPPRTLSRPTRRRAIANDLIDFTAARMMGDGNVAAVVAGVGSLAVISFTFNIVVGALAGYGV